MIEVKDICFDFEQHNSLFTTIAIGEKISKGADLFRSDFDKDNILDTDKKLLPNFEIYFRQKALFIVKEIDKPLIIKFIRAFIASFPNQSWEQSTKQLTIYFNWEFENYQE